VREDDDLTDERNRYFGPLDPYVWFLVVPMWIVAAAVAIMSIAVGLIVLAAGGVVLAFDSWLNRPRPELDYWEREGAAFDGRERFANTFSRY
jgi:hypothetical protein